MAQPSAAPIATPAASGYSTSPSAQSTPPELSATTRPSTTNGNASPSLKPASAVIAKRGSSSRSSPGGPIPMSPASTGSVGASAAASTIAAPVERPSSAPPSSAATKMNAG